ncbi:hypothetical protein [Pseudalkalibacillus caeni]|nr:hypothetical protein [Pseudalkalibacillus caeni]
MGNERKARKDKERYEVYKGDLNREEFDSSYEYTTGNKASQSKYDKK